jgi:hypothetical protein
MSKKDFYFSCIDLLHLSNTQYLIQETTKLKSFSFELHVLL